MATLPPDFTAAAKRLTLAQEFHALSELLDPSYRSPFHLGADDELIDLLAPVREAYNAAYAAITAQLCGDDGDAWGDEADYRYELARDDAMHAAGAGGAA